MLTPFILSAQLLLGGFLIDPAEKEKPMPDSPPKQSADAKPAEPDAEPALNPNVKTKTLGGRQLWGDVRYFRGWRIQQQVYTKHYRLLDATDVRHAWGTLGQCQARLKQVRDAENLPAMSGEAVILVHGIIRSSKSMAALQKRFETEGYTAVPFDYPSTRIDISGAADYLHQVIENLGGIEKIHFVCHSMGGLVVRAYTAKHHDARVGRVVMIATPNVGAELADKLKANAIFKLVLGPSGQQLTSEEAGFIASLPVPDLEFAVIAGGRLTDDGYNPLVPGDDDGTVSVDSTRLPGAADFIVLKGLHTFLTSQPEVLDASVRFLKEGRLRTEGVPESIPKATPK
ncbi:MAG: alpha/beta fold hydrolase [Planctomycetales bacterium]|nr:alpha/beta fold hydrolase [Planctomycetales bacterium]